ncbi:MAG: hypothetical protein ACO331_01015 [Prochlorothrix sp.]
MAPLFSVISGADLKGRLQIGDPRNRSQGPIAGADRKSAILG